MMKKAFVLFAALHLSAAFAAQIPQSLPTDSRIATAYYDPKNVTEIFVKPGVFTQIVFEDGEEHEVHALGDEDAWYFAAYKNYIFLKPKQTDGTTNFSVITNKRDYMFKVHYVDNPNVKDMYQVRFIYPDTIAKQKKQADEKAKIENGFNTSKLKKTYNLDYTMRVKGDRTIAPINVYDDGTFTYFKFAGNVDLPAIYAVDGLNMNSYGKEILVNQTITGAANDTVVMHKIHGVWRLRLDKTVIDIYNDGLNKYGAKNYTMTASPNVQRVEIDQDQGDDDE